MRVKVSKWGPRRMRGEAQEVGILWGMSKMKRKLKELPEEIEGEGFEMGTPQNARRGSGGGYSVGNEQNET